VTAGVRDRPESRLGVRLFAVAPLLAFALLEHVERLVAHGEVPYGTALEAPFLVGLALQLPFAVTALCLLRGLHRLGHALGRALRRSLGLSRPLRLDPLAFGLVHVALEPDRPRTSVLALGYGQRAPPCSVGV
jgi:hypothetical protein